MIEGEASRGGPGAALSLLTAGIDLLQSLQRSGLSEDDLRAILPAVEQQQHRLYSAKVQLLAEIAERNVAGRLGLRGLPSLILADLRCTYRTAKDLARAVDRFGSRRALTGEPLEPRFPTVSQALADGRLSAQHADVIAAAIEALPTAVRAEHAGEVAAALVELAAERDPAAVQLLGQRIVAHLSPDGPAAQQAGLSGSDERWPSDERWSTSAGRTGGRSKD